MSEAPNKKKREFRNIHVTQLSLYRLPLAGVISFLHRVSGALMFLLLPLTLYMLDQSLLSEGTFEAFKGFAGNWFVKLVVLALSWAFLQHFFAGLRH
ncbi:MAG: succinate dehydrogenase, cytochrome b556 subunit, partial [Pseudomonadota bacterium]|nr:succinate dehydrogenase, cytochrome b556 subunit [Pseudomonadota bacterium]